MAQQKEGLNNIVSLSEGLKSTWIEIDSNVDAANYDDKCVNQINDVDRDNNTAMMGKDSFIDFDIF